jgi:hypothetical protein
MVAMVSFKNVLEDTILELYEHYSKTNERLFSIEQINMILPQKTLTIRSYIQKLVSLNLIEKNQVVDNNVVIERFYLTDRLIEKGKKLHEEKIKPIVEEEKVKVEEKKTDELGFFKH